MNLYNDNNGQMAHRLHGDSAKPLTVAELPRTFIRADCERSDGKQTQKARKCGQYAR